ncbi:LysR family transcriptional regulator [Allopusillimonas soli]|uniref:LysR family transcriptional regulator n=1 Tax=Allopusillimonas soli TaxID=659016 RepID=A0A853F4D2_9BURK|nr:LysR family transcriptional regulator [Allopusillimonas soli]NYT35335.1 LysR family transcriptional regulator [Allopusillimonas soli]TEA75757.1 LysR family transcriptional regulator [Allopusillimonas soli]
MSIRNLDDLAVFVHVAEQRSFSAAARDLHLAPKLVSARIARLERALGTSLFERNTRHLRITDEGRAIADRARMALSALEEMQALASGGGAELRGTLRITAPAPFGRKYVTPAIGDFCCLHPGVAFDLRLSDQVQDIYAGDFDLAIRIGELADSRLVAQRIAENRRILVAAPAYLREHGSPQTPEDLASHRCLVFAYPGFRHDTWPLRNGRRDRPTAVTGTLCSDNGDVLRTWCLAGLGISLRETWDIHEELRDGRLLRLLPQWEAVPSKISLVRARREPVPRRLSVFMDFLLARWRATPWDDGLLP